jgi:hypothetical protein
MDAQRERSDVDEDRKGGEKLHWRENRQLGGEPIKRLSLQGTPRAGRDDNVAGRAASLGTS